MTHDEDPALPQAGAVDHPPSPDGPDGAQAAVTPEPPATGDPTLDELLLALARASAVPVEDRLTVIEAVHRGLQDRLADVEG
jgi:hypothetical protein